MKTIARYAARNSKILSKHINPLSSLESIYNLLDDSQKETAESDLARLYLQFYKPQKPGSKNKNPLSMLSEFTAKNETRYYLNYIQVTDNYAVASNGHYLLKTKMSLNIETGFYDPKLLVKTEGPEFCKYPDFSNALAGAFETIASLDDVTDVMCYAGDGKKKKPFETYQIGGHYYLGDYIKKIRSLFPGIHANINAPGTLKIETDDYIVVLIPTIN